MFTGRMLPHVLHRGKGQEAPELVIVSAGFDALDVDPLANIELVPADYEELARSIMDAVADAGGHQAVVCGLEGGYNLESGGISSAAVHTARGLAGL
jgi:acetoin utilization deacetylase AcuC-like enzyme